jgi:hypothetical protein
MGKIKVRRIKEETSLDTLEKNKMNCVNWPETYPYLPDVYFSIAHNNQSILLKFFVEERFVRALVAEDNGEVWTDSCVEFFIGLDETGYYNFEFNCIGTALLGFRKEKEHCVHADKKIMNHIIRKPSLGKHPFPEKEGIRRWELSLQIPVSSFFKHRIQSLSGVSAKANFYKCGDKLSLPHFVSWNPIHSPSPNFHLEAFFGDLVFE